MTKNVIRSVRSGTNDRSAEGHTTIMDELAIPGRTECSYRIEEHLPARRLVLVWQGRGAHLPARCLALAAALVALSGALGFFLSHALPVMRKQAADVGDDALFMAVFSGMISLGVCLGTLYVVRGVGRLTAYTSTMIWDAQDDLFEAIQSGGMFFGRRRLRGALSGITSLEMAVGAELPLGRLPITISCLAPGKGVEKIVLPLPIDHVDCRADALELFCDLARITNHPAYLVCCNNARTLRLAMKKTGRPGAQKPPDDGDGEDDEEIADEELDEDENEADPDGDLAHQDECVPASSRAAPIFEVPPVGQRAELTGPVLVHCFEEPTEALPAFDPESLADEKAESRLVEWDPPRRFHSWRRAVERSVVVVAALVAAVAGAVVGAWPLNGLTESIAALPPSRWETGILGALLAALLAGFLVWALHRPREVMIDGPAGTLTCRQGEQVRGYRTDQVCEVTLIGEREMQADAGNSGKQVQRFRCRIELGLAQSDEWVLDSPWSERRAAPYRQLQSLAVDLARMLNVPWRWQDYDQPSKPAWHRRLGWKEQAVLTALVLSLVGYLGSQAIKRNIERDTAEAMRAAGTEISFMNGYSIQNHLVLADYWQVTIKPRSFDNDKLSALAGQLQQLDRVGLVLADTALGDAAMPVIGQVGNLLLLDANSTNLTSAGLESLARLDRLVCLSLANTIVGDSGIERLPPLPRLRFLNLSSTNLTDRGVGQLARFPSLEYVSLYNLQISDAAVERLKAARPNLEVAR